MKTMIELTSEEEKSVNGGMGYIPGSECTDALGNRYVLGIDGQYRTVDMFGNIGGTIGDLILPPGL